MAGWFVGFTAEKEDTVSYAVGLLLDDVSESTAIALSREYRGRAADRDFVLRPDSPIPYIAHVHLQLDNKGVQAVKAEIDRIAPATNAPRGRFGEIATENGTWLFWKTPRTPDLMAHHEAVINACVPHRTGPVDVTWPMTPEQRQVWERIGYPAALECFDPKIMLQKLALRHARQPVRLESCGWTALCLALFRTGRYGSAQEILHSCDFADTPRAPRAA